MKTIVKNDTYYRVDDNTADFKVRNEGYQFCSKEKWKRVNLEHSRNNIDTKPKEAINEMVAEGVADRVKKNYQKPKKS